MSESQSKYRILLSISELRLLSAIIDGNSEFSALHKRFNLAIRKAEAGITKTSYIPIGKKSIEAQMGLESDDRASAIYSRWRAGENLEDKLITMAKEYAYENNLFSPSEIIEYENFLMFGHSNP